MSMSNSEEDFETSQEMDEENVDFLQKKICKKHNICFNCNKAFRSETSLIHHLEYCSISNLGILLNPEILQWSIPLKWSVMLTETSILKQILMYEIENVEELVYLYHIYMSKLKNVIEDKSTVDLMCIKCKKTFSTNSNLKKHIRKCNDNENDFLNCMPLEIYDISILEGIIGYVNDIINNGNEMTSKNKLDIFIYNFMKKNNRFVLEIENMDIGLVSNIVSEPKTYLYFNMSTNKFINSFDSKIFINHMNISAWTNIYYSDEPMLTFVQQLFILNENCNIYVEDIQKRKIIIFLNIMDVGNKRYNNILLRPTNSVFILKEWMRTMYLLYLNYLEVYFQKYVKIETELNRVLYRTLKTHLSKNYINIFKTDHSFSLFVDKLLKTYEKYNMIVLNNFKKSVVDYTIYKGHLTMLNKIFNENMSIITEPLEEENDQTIEQIGSFITDTDIYNN